VGARRQELGEKQPLICHALRDTFSRKGRRKKEAPMLIVRALLPLREKVAFVSANDG